MGNQGTADPGFRRGAELVRAGAIGEVQRGPRLDQPPVQVLEAGAGHRRATQGDVAGPRRTCTGTCSWGRPPSVPTTRSIIPTTGAAGGTSAPARWATWPATRPTWPSWRLQLGLPDAGLGPERRDQLRDLSGLGDDHLRVPGPRQPAARQAHLVRGRKGRQAQPAARPDSSPTGASSRPTAARS